MAKLGEFSPFSRSDPRALSITRKDECLLAGDPCPSVTVFFDPGKTTGCASFDHRYGMFSSLEIENLAELGKHIELLLLVNDQYEDFRLEVGWERYIVTPGNSRHGNPYWSLEAIGVLRYLCLKHDVTILSPHTSSMMTLVPDERLKAVGWFTPGKGHANDAARHLLSHMVTSGELPPDLRDRAFS